MRPIIQVRVLDVETETVTTEDVLVLGTDGLWDVVSSKAWGGGATLPKSWGYYIATMQVSNEEVAAIVQRGLQVLLRISPTYLAHNFTNIS